MLKNQIYLIFIVLFITSCNGGADRKDLQLPVARRKEVKQDESPKKDNNLQIGHIEDSVSDGPKQNSVRISP